MRYSTLVFAASLAVFASFGAGSAIAQKAERPVLKDPPPAIEVKPVEDFVIDYLAVSDRERGGDSAAAYVMGRVTDFSGRSVRGAEITLYNLDSDDVKRVVTNGFGYYRFPNLNDGQSYLISVKHRRYLFVMGSTSFTLEGAPIQIDFQAEEMP
jgi:hypothetical protein